MNHVSVRLVESVGLGFGLEWLPLVTGRPDRSARRLARQHKASHMVFAGDAAASVGLVLGNSVTDSGATEVHSAAQIVAGIFASGTVAVVLPLTDALRWMVAVHEGAVLARTDVLFEQVDEIRPILDDLRRAHPSLRLLDAESDIAPPSLPEIAGAANTFTRLVPLRGWQRLPKPYVAAALCVLLALAGWSAWAPEPAQSPLVETDLDVNEIWRQAIHEAANGIHLQGVHGSRLLLKSLLALPTAVRGWELARADCQPVAANWSCSAVYIRQASHATNAEFFEGAPPHWEIAFPTMEHADIRWQTPGHITSLSSRPVHSRAHNNKQFQSSLQRIKPAFSRLYLGESKPLEVGLARGAPAIARPASLPLLASRQFEASGPLRSAFLLLPLVEDVAWNKVTLTLGKEVSANLRVSRLNISLSGDLYETQ